MVVAALSMTTLAATGAVIASSHRPIVFSVEKKINDCAAAVNKTDHICQDIKVLPRQ